MRKKTIQYFFIFIVAFCISQASSWTSVFASSYLTQLQNTTNIPVTSGAWLYNGYGTSSMDFSGQPWFNAVSGTTYYVEIVAPTATAHTCSDFSVLFYTTGGSNMGGGSTGTGTSTCVFTVNPNTNPVQGILIYDFTSGASFTLRGNSFTSYATKDYPSGSHLQYGIPVIRVNDTGVFPPFPVFDSFNQNQILVSTPENNSIITTPFDVTISGSYSYIENTPYAYDKLAFSFVNFSTVGIATIPDVDLTTSPQNGTFSFPYTLIDGSHYSFRAYYYNSTDSSIPYHYSDEIQFDAGTSTGIVPLGGIYQVCTGITDIGCHLKNAFAWAFVPSSSSVIKFKTISLSTTFPFSYVYDVGTGFNELFSNSGSMEYAVSADTGALGTFNFISASQINAVPYSSTIKVILGWLLWFYTGMFLYRILLKAHD